MATLQTRPRASLTLFAQRSNPVSANRCQLHESGLRTISVLCRICLRVGYQSSQSYYTLSYRLFSDSLSHHSSLSFQSI